MTQEQALLTMKTGRNIFLTGAPGTGKTYVLNQYLDYLKQHGVEAAVTAPTGIAASHINGTTLHSFFGIGIKESLTQYDIENLSEKKYLWDRMKNLKVLVIDEVSMLSPELFDSLDILLKTFKFCYEPFGGVQVILVGDFFQLPPVNKKSVEKRFVFQSNSWNELGLSVCYLTRSYRHSDESLLEVLSEIRRGSVSEKSMQVFRSRYKKMPEGVSRITKLYTHNIDVDTINHKSLAEIPGLSKKYKANTKGAQAFVDKIFNNSLVVKDLELKKGALVFFIKNNYEKGYINGTLGEIVGFDTFDVPIVKTFSGKEIKAQREEWIFEDGEGKPRASISQIPLRLAWAITIHKSQGMTLEAAEVDLSKAFEPGQGYVALSRISCIDGLCLLGLNDEALQVDSGVLNFDTELQEQSKDLGLFLESQGIQGFHKEAELFLKKIGGFLGKHKDDELENFGKVKSKSFLESKPFFEEKMNITEVAKKRGLTEGTIFKHLTDIIKDDPEFDISYLQPDSDVILKVEEALLYLKAHNEGIAEDGGIKLKAIFEQLGEKISYDTIRLALLFLEE